MLPLSSDRRPQPTPGRAIGPPGSGLVVAANPPLRTPSLLVGAALRSEVDVVVRGVEEGSTRKTPRAIRSATRLVSERVGPRLPVRVEVVERAGRELIDPVSVLVHHVDVFLDEVRVARVRDPSAARRPRRVEVGPRAAGELSE